MYRFDIVAVQPRIGEHVNDQKHLALEETWVLSTESVG